MSQYNKGESEYEAETQIKSSETGSIVFELTADTPDDKFQGILYVFIEPL